eukprot:scaffold86825_cov19-Tisochrysis_lutea.AAC.2
MEGEGAEEGRDGEEATAQGCAQPGSGAPAPADVDSGSGNGPAGGVGATMPAPAASSGKGDGVTRRDGGKHVHTSAARLAAVHVVTAQEAEEGKFSIEDVVLPMPGVRVQVCWAASIDKRKWRSVSYSVRFGVCAFAGEHGSRVWVLVRHELACMDKNVWAGSAGWTWHCPCMHSCPHHS